MRIASFKGAHFKRIAGKNPLGEGHVRLAPMWVNLWRIFAATDLKLGNRRANRIGDVGVAPAFDKNLAIAVNHAGKRMRHHHTWIG